MVSTTAVMYGYASQFLVMLVFFHNTLVGFWGSIKTIDKYKKIKLKGEVGMAVPKSTQTRVLGITTYMGHPTLAFLVTIHVCIPVFFVHMI